MLATAATLTIFLFHFLILVFLLSPKKKYPYIINQFSLTILLYPHFRES